MIIICTGSKDYLEDMTKKHYESMYVSEPLIGRSGEYSSPYSPLSEVFDDLRRKAEEIGADAVIDIVISRCYDVWTNYTVIGQPVKLASEK